MPLFFFFSLSIVSYSHRINDNSLEGRRRVNLSRLYFHFLLTFFLFIRTNRHPALRASIFLLLLLLLSLSFAFAFADIQKKEKRASHIKHHPMNWFFLCTHIWMVRARAQTSTFSLSLSPSLGWGEKSVSLAYPFQISFEWTTDIDQWRQQAARLQVSRSTRKEVSSRNRFVSILQVEFSPMFLVKSVTIIPRENIMESSPVMGKSTGHDGPPLDLLSSPLLTHFPLTAARGTSLRRSGWQSHLAHFQLRRIFQTFDSTESSICLQKSWSGQLSRR